MKNLVTTLAGILMVIALAFAMLLIVFPQQWKQNIYPSISQILPVSLSRVMPVGIANNNVCNSLEDNLQSFADYLKANQDVVDVKGMNSIDDQLIHIKSRINSMPNEVRSLVCQQEYTRLEGLKSVFSLGRTN